MCYTYLWSQAVSGVKKWVKSSKARTFRIFEKWDTGPIQQSLLVGVGATHALRTENFPMCPKSEALKDCCVDVFPPKGSAKLASQQIEEVIGYAPKSMALRGPHAAQVWLWTRGDREAIERMDQMFFLNESLVEIFPKI
ncbi:MAG: hypothetical protein OXJ55_17790 [Caldilineaceae bacterium]|nr:hypothetical protein [Caldilineaceae bacterium]